MFATIDEITINWEDDGILKVKELDKEVLSKGAWTTILFLYKDWNPTEEAYGNEKVTIRRYRKIRGTYQQQSKFNISSEKQGLKIIDILQKWFSTKQ